MFETNNVGRRLVDPSENKFAQVKGFRAPIFTIAWARGSPLKIFWHYGIRPAHELRDHLCFPRCFHRSVKAAQVKIHLDPQGSENLLQQLKLPGLYMLHPLTTRAHSYFLKSWHHLTSVGGP